MVHMYIRSFIMLCMYIIDPNVMLTSNIFGPELPLYGQKHSLIIILIHLLEAVRSNEKHEPAICIQIS